MHDEETIERKRKIEKKAAIKFKEFEQEHLTGHGYSYKFIVEAGLPHFRIEMFLQNNPVGLLVVGGSVAQHFDENKTHGFEKFLQGSKIPVVVVPHEPGAPSGSE
jgi:nucleotide-binding universal stress UspA family protein